MFQGIDLAASLRRQHVEITSQAAGWQGTFTPDAVRYGSLNNQAAVERQGLAALVG